ncbi:MAG: DNA polymerase III subunit gamma/tau [Chlamydiae bacterium]|nr:DNA polymerase III subunit gamma/tau [Chlamydiota bacterium]
MTSFYQIIPRKYRPQSFKEIICQEAIVTTLKHALKSNHLGQAYLFSGSRGTGKTTLARLLAKALNCHQLDEDFEPCNSCTSCREITSGCSLDVIEIDGASNRGIDDIRKINETTHYATSSSKFKIYIIDEVHMLTKEAFNALLKTLEEPPLNVKFFFATTEPHKVLPTILSRCQRFDLKRIDPSKIVEKLKRISQELKIIVDEDVLWKIGEISDGSLRDAESILDQLICFGTPPIQMDHAEKLLGLTPKSLLFQLDEAIFHGRIEFAFALSETLFSSGRELVTFLDHLMDHFRIYLSLKLNQKISFLGEEETKKYKEHLQMYSQEDCLYILDLLIQWTTTWAKNAFKRVQFEILLLHLIRAKSRISIDVLVQRLCALEQEMKPPVVDTSSPLPIPLPALENEKKPKPEKHPSHYDTLIRFAAVELNGNIEGKSKV